MLFPSTPPVSIMIFYRWRHLLILYALECRECKFCKSGKTNLCGSGSCTPSESWTLSDDTYSPRDPGSGPDARQVFPLHLQGAVPLPLRTCPRKSLRSRPALILRSQMGTSTFSQYTVVADVSVVAVNPKAPLDRVCLLGCGITTAWGAVVKQPGIGTLFLPDPHKTPLTLALRGLHCRCLRLRRHRSWRRRNLLPRQGVARHRRRHEPQQGGVGTQVRRD